ncbi:peptidylprolyl isomerase [Sphingomonas sabuli]|uniref:peptidylprolyl isomerase n=1 Tax=Sphingomonas sabuli TaxID=2764186 RepID=A0A7G9KZP1_9SPHN|nr:peptidylprolyl isomerase [Sphingomonas sabuli]QNM81840.1 peptidylprolyl isomerase [Sphingomonas sabuli]
MTRLFLAAALLSAAPAAAQAPAATPTVAEPAAQEDLVPVAIDTAMGRIVIALDRGRAPLTTANFLKYVDAGKLDGEVFYRAMPYGKGGLIQGGITGDARKLNPPVAFESTDQTGLSNVAGTVAMAALAPGKAQADFFIMTTDIKSFDGPAGFAAFGRVIEGMDVVQAILAAPVSPTKGIGPMKGQMLEPQVKIVKAARVK